MLVAVRMVSCICFGLPFCLICGVTMLCLLWLLDSWLILSCNFCIGSNESCCCDAHCSLLLSFGAGYDRSYSWFSVIFLVSVGVIPCCSVLRVGALLFCLPLVLFVHN
jgi:hypothetical protein